MGPEPPAGEPCVGSGVLANRGRLAPRFRPDDAVETRTIFTTEANGAVRHVYGRIPAGSNSLDSRFPRREKSVTPCPAAKAKSLLVDSLKDDASARAELQAAPERLAASLTAYGAQRRCAARRRQNMP